MRRSLTMVMAAAFLGAATASIAIAQPAAGPGPRRFDDRAFNRPTERVEARLAYIKTALKITAAQEPQWNAYADVLRKNAREMDQRFQARQQQRRAGPASRRPEARPNAIERLERLQSFHAQAVTQLNELLAAEKPLYAALSPEQQRVADEVLAPGHRGMMMRAMMMRHGGFPRGDRG